MGITNEIRKAFIDDDPEIFYPLMRRFLIKVLVEKNIVNPFRINDLVQDALIQIHRKKDMLKDSRAVVAWSKTIVIRLAINYVERNHDDTAILDKDMAWKDEDPANDMILEDRKNHINWVLNNLSEIDRVSLRQFYFCGMSLKDMSAIDDTPIGTIKRRLHVARKNFKKLANQEELMGA